jgi:hypothetical protein
MFRDQICMYRDQTVWSLMLSTVLVHDQNTTYNNKLCHKQSQDYICESI